MTKQQLEHFKKTLLKWKNSIESEKQVESQIDSIDYNALSNKEEEEIANQNNIIDFQQKRSEYQSVLLREIEYALKKIENRTFGICEETDEPINLERLKANPIARYSIEAQRLLENSN